MADKQGWEKAADADQLEMAPIVDVGPALVVGTAALERRQSVAIANVMQLDKPMRRLTTIITYGRFYRGDLMNLAETLFADEAAQIVDAEHLTEAEAVAEKLVAKSVKPTTRAHAQSWDHARAVLALKDTDQVEWLDRSRGEGWTARRLSSEIEQASAGPAKTTMRWWLVVECGTEAKRDKLADELGPRGFRVKKQEKLTKVEKPKKAKKGPVTAKKKKGAPPMNTRKRVPK